MGSFRPVVLRLASTVYCALKSERITDHSYAEKRNDQRRTVIRQGICIEAAVASTLFVYIAWLCFRKWYFEELIVTPDNMLRGCVFVLVAALGAKLCWVVWSKVQPWLKKH